jgi:single-stranded-DNA-specific exonuclease
MKWALKTPESIPKELNSLSLNPITLQLLAQRGFLSISDIERFLNTKYEDLHSPYHLNGINEAVKRISKSIKKKEKVVIYGDYDADGITSTALLKEALQEIGLNPKTYIPDRNTEGYGINKKALDFIKSSFVADLIITVDCGISNKEEIKYANKKGIDVIVTDHHSVPKELPKNSILINPKLPGQRYPFKELAGVGVVFKLVQALWEQMIPKKVDGLKWYLDLVAIGTIADCVPLIDENRIFARFGLIVLQKTRRMGIQEIIKTGRINIDALHPPTVQNVAYQIGPRFNAAGRMDHADLALNLLTEKDQVKARLSALEIESKNSERQKVTQQILEEIRETVSPNKDHKLIIRKSANWPMGLLGVVAGKIAEEYHCPVFILREGKKLYEGSGRSIEGLDLFASVGKVDKYLDKYGGHAQAMGIKIKPKNLSGFEKDLAAVIKKDYSDDIWGKKIYIDAAINSAEIDWDIFSEIRKLEPFGEGNREPVFLSRNVQVREINLVGNGQKHIKFLFGINGGTKIISGIFFKAAEKFIKFKPGDKVSIIYNLRSNNWNGNHKLDLNVIDIKKENNP